MKRIVPVLLFLASFHVCAEPELIATAKNQAGGLIALFSQATACSSGFGVVIRIPFQDDVPGCVTDQTKTGFHVFYKNGQEVDYPYAGWTPFKS